jgi:citrate synthase
MSDTAKLELEGKVYEFPIVEGTEGEKAVDISSLRSSTGYITLDDGYSNTGSCKSSVTFIDGEQGILRYRGIPIEATGGAIDFCRDGVFDHLRALAHEQGIAALFGDADGERIAA